MRTADGVSPVPGGSVGFSLVLFFVSYMSIFGAGTCYMLRMIGRGPAVATPEDEQRPGAGTPARPMSLPDERIEPAEEEIPDMALDLPLIWAGVLAFAVFMSVPLEGFDLGIGLLFQSVTRHDDGNVIVKRCAPDRKSG